MASELGNAYVNIIPKAPGIQGNVENILNGASGGAARAGQSIGKKLLGGIAALGIGSAVAGMIKSAFEAGGALEQSFGGLDTIYGESAAAMKQYAMSASEYGLSANDYAEQAVSMGAALKQAFSGDTAAAAEAANMAMQDMADNAAKMGTPIESLQNAYAGFAKGNYTMLDNLKLGYGGTKTEMERLLADAQELTGVEYDINNLGDIYSAIHAIQGELDLTGVAAGEAQTTLTGSLNSVKASWTNVMAALTTGEGLDTAMANFSASVGNFANNVLKMLTALIPQIPTLIKGLADAVITNAPQFIASGAELIVQLAVGLVQSIPQIVAKVPEIFKGIKNAFSQVDWASLGKDLINGIINGLVSAASGLYSKVKDIIKNALSQGKAEAEIGSPSRLFAREIGQWIPAGIALGVDEGAPEVNASVTRAIDGAVVDLNRAAATPTAQTEGDADRIIAALRDMRVMADVSLQGDARQLFRVINNTNRVRTKATNYNVLAAAGGA